MKDFQNKKQEFKEGVLAQIKHCILFLNKCKSQVALQLLEYMIVHGNLYLVSEAYEVSLLEHMPYLSDQYKKNEMVGILLVHDLLKMLITLYEQEQVEVLPFVNKYFDARQEGSNSTQVPIELILDFRNLYLVNGRLKYCAPLISPVHNIGQSDESTAHSKARTDHLHAVHKLIFYFVVNSNYATS